MFNKFFSLLLFFSVASALVADEPDPAAASNKTGNVTVDNLYDHVTFYLNFDGGSTRPLLSSGAIAPKRTAGKPAYEKGLRGEALRISTLTFPAQDIMSLRQSGTVMFWVSPWNWPEKGQKEPIFGWFSSGSKKHEYSFSITHMAHSKFGEGRVNVYLNLPPKKQVIQNQIVGQGSPVNWKNGSWNLIVVTWSPAGWAVSVNGKPFISKVFPYTLEETERFSIGSREKDDPQEWQSLIDEFVILDVRMTDEQVKQAYAQGLQMISSDSKK